MRLLPLAAVPMLVLHGSLAAQEPEPKGKAQAPPASPAQRRATAEIEQFLRRATDRLVGAALADVRTLEDWQRARPRLRQELREMLGLWPMPEQTALRPTITGTVDGGDFVVEKLHFQSRPGLYVTANFYRPKQVEGPLPAILYGCGHGEVKVDGVSYGNKVRYQHHAAWFARNGYCCLVLDTLQLGEIEGIHHGLRQYGRWWWSARGYASAGVEAWNCIRALDYLETRPEVDMARVGVTGRSGGGNYTWLTAALDDRPACFVPVSGITALEDHVVGGRVATHCDCMYPVNTYAWDFATLAALAAPRPLLFANTDKDPNHPLDGIYRMYAQLRRIYGLYDAPDKLGLLITEGAHEDTQDLQVPAFRWMNRWLKGTDAPIDALADQPFTPQQLKVFADLPADQANTTIDETFVPRAPTPPVPGSKDDWERERDRLLADLRARCFRNWPADPGPLDVTLVGEHEAEGLALQVLEYTSEENLRLPIYVVRAAGAATPSLLTVSAVDTAGWRRWLAGMAPAFAGQLPGGRDVEPDRAALAVSVKVLGRGDRAIAVVPPRGEGPNAWDPDPCRQTTIRRQFLLVGRTVDDGQVWDVRRTLQALGSRPDLRGARTRLRGSGRMAGVALYAGLFEPAVERFDLRRLPTSHRDGPIFLNVLRVVDLPQALALAFPRRVDLSEAVPGDWSWADAVARLYDAPMPPLRFHPAAGGGE